MPGKTLVDLKSLIQARLDHLQNPENCDDAKKLFCKFSLYCGYGCQVHHAIYCFILAYATERTLIIEGGTHFISTFQYLNF